MYFTAFAWCVLKQMLANQTWPLFRIAVFCNISVAICVWWGVRSSRRKRIHFHIFLYFTIYSCKHHLKTFSFWVFVSFTPLVGRLGGDLETKRGPWEGNCGSRWRPQKREKVSKGTKTRDDNSKGPGNGEFGHRSARKWKGVRSDTNKFQLIRKRRRRQRGKFPGFVNSGYRRLSTQTRTRTSSNW